MYTSTLAQYTRSSGSPQTLSALCLCAVFIGIAFFSYLGTIHLRCRHLLGGEGVKNLPNLPTDGRKKTADGRGVRVKNREKFADVLSGWSLTYFSSSSLLSTQLV